MIRSYEMNSHCCAQQVNFSYNEIQANRTLYDTPCLLCCLHVCNLSAFRCFSFSSISITYHFSFTILGEFLRFFYVFFLLKCIAGLYFVSEALANLNCIYVYMYVYSTTTVKLFKVPAFRNCNLVAASLTVSLTSNDACLNLITFLRRDRCR